MVTLDKKPFTFNWSKKNRLTFFFFNFPDAETKYQSPGPGMYLLTADRSNLKAFENEKLSMARLMEFSSRLTENIVEKGRKCRLPPFSFPTTFLRTFFLMYGKH